MLSKGFRRVRKPNYTREETEILLDQLLIYGNVLFGKSQPGVNNQQRADVWTSIASMVNAVPNSAGRTVDELKHRWQDLAQRARVALRKHSDNREQLLSKKMPFMDKVLRIMGEIRPDSMSLRGCHSPGYSNSNDTSDIDSFSRVEIKQEMPDAEKDPPVITKKTGKSFKQVMTPLKTPSLKRFKRGRSYESSSLSSFPHSNQNGNSSVGSSYHSLGHDLELDVSQSLTILGEPKMTDLYTPPTKSRKKVRPMVMDPESQFIMEVDMMEEYNISGSSTEGNKGEETSPRDEASPSSEPDVSAAYRGKDVESLTQTTENGIPLDDYQKNSKWKSNGITSVSDQSSVHPVQGISPHDETTSHEYDVMTTAQLERVCLISKIQKQNQQRCFFKLKEEKVHLEIELLKRKILSLPSCAAGIHTSPVSSLVHDPDNSSYHLRRDQQLLSPLMSSGALEFEVVSETKEHNGKIIKEEKTMHGGPVENGKTSSLGCVEKEAGSIGDREVDDNCYKSNGIVIEKIQGGIECNAENGSSLHSMKKGTANDSSEVKQSDHQAIQIEEKNTAVDFDSTLKDTL